jgi:hypothetical protein
MRHILERKDKRDKENGCMVSKSVYGCSKELVHVQVSLLCLLETLKALNWARSYQQKLSDQRNFQKK